MLVSMSSGCNPIIFWVPLWALAQGPQALLVHFLPYLKPVTPQRSLFLLLGSGFQRPHAGLGGGDGRWGSSAC